MDDGTNHSPRWRYVISKNVTMRLFKKKSPKEKLNEKYAKLLKEAHQLSTVDRRKSDEKVAEAEAVLNQLKELEG